MPYFTSSITHRSLQLRKTFTIWWICFFCNYIKYKCILSILNHLLFLFTFEKFGFLVQVKIRVENCNQNIVTHKLRVYCYLHKYRAIIQNKCSWGQQKTFVVSKTMKLLNIHESSSKNSMFRLLRLRKIMFMPIAWIVSLLNNYEN